MCVVNAGCVTWNQLEQFQTIKVYKVLETTNEGRKVKVEADVTGSSVETGCFHTMKANVF